MLRNRLKGVISGRFKKYNKKDNKNKENLNGISSKSPILDEG